MNKNRINLTVSDKLYEAICKKVHAQRKLFQKMGVPPKFSNPTNVCLQIVVSQLIEEGYYKEAHVYDTPDSLQKQEVD